MPASAENTDVSRDAEKCLDTLLAANRSFLLTDHVKIKRVIRTFTRIQRNRRTKASGQENRLRQAMPAGSARGNWLRTHPCPTELGYFQLDGNREFLSSLYCVRLPTSNSDELRSFSR